MNGLSGLALKTLAGVAMGAMLVGSASAADLAAPEPVVAAEVPSMIDVAFGVAGVTDYRFRGITNSKKDPAIQGYAELQVADWVYAGVWGSSVNFPRPLSDPSMEIDFYGGIRHSFGPVTIDVGGQYYYYPGEAKFARDTDYWEIYAKPSFTLFDVVSVTGNAFWTSDFVNLGNEALYLSVIPKVTIPVAAFPDVSFYASGEFGKQWFDKSRLANPRDYTTWNIGAGATYKAVTLDVRYSDTDLNKRECALNTGVRGWCGNAVVGKISFDTSLSKLK